MHDAPLPPISAGTRAGVGCWGAGAWLAALLATVVAVLAGWSVIRHLGSLTFASDDSYIYAGYVKMAFTPGAGLFSYNIGEHSAGTTGLAHYYLQVALWLPWFTLMRRPPQPGELEGLAWIVAWLCSAATAVWIGQAAVVLGEHAGLARGWPRTLAALTATGLVYAHPAHVWGVFSGMENPLGALCATGLGVLCLTGARTLAPVGLLSALLCATRPEWIPVAALLPAAWARWRSPVARRRHDLIVAYAVFLGVLLALFLPLRLTTGQWQPEAYGARAHLSLRRILRPDWAGLGSVFTRHWTLLLALSAGVAAWAARRERAYRAGLVIPVTLLAFFVMRGMFKLTDFNVHDRYVSYLWPAMVLAMVPGMVLVWRRLQLATPITRIAPIVLVAVAATLGVAQGVALLRRDGREMLQVVKAPSQWMAANLPQGSVVCMEPAGAIRTFTDFSLVDRTGLTTRHFHRFKAGGADPIRNYCEYLHAQGVAYVFDYPEHMPNRCTSLRVLNSWEPQQRWQTGGRVAVMALGEDRSQAQTAPKEGGPPPVADP